jgi:hypothetical protein
MFLRFGAMFKAGFGSDCGTVESPEAVAKLILAKSPMAVVLVTLHLELVTQSHYIDCMRDTADLDPLFRSLFKYHWLEEAQHAKIDRLEVLKLRRDASPESVNQAVSDYFAIAAAFAQILADQARLDLVSLEAAVGRRFSDEERSVIVDRQRRSYQRAFLWAGVTSKPFLEFLTEHFPEALPGAAQAARTFA